MHIFFEPNFPHQSSLSADESKHAFRVLRLRLDDEIIVINGKGGRFHCAITAIDKKSCDIRILDKKVISSKPYRIHVAIAPTKNIDRIEWFVEKCIEFGIDEISFILSKNSERKIIKTERINRIAIAAMKQSQQVFYPIINEIRTLAEFLEECSDSTKYIAHLVNQDRQSLKTIDKNKDYCILIGPEGDFNEEEVHQAFSKDFKPVHLGNSRLRTETAGIAACHILNFVHDS